MRSSITSIFFNIDVMRSRIQFHLVSDFTKVSQDSSRDKAKQEIIQLTSCVTLLFLYLDIICVVICWKHYQSSFVYKRNEYSRVKNMYFSLHLWIVFCCCFLIPFYISFNATFWSRTWRICGLKLSFTSIHLIYIFMDKKDI